MMPALAHQHVEGSELALDLGHEASRHAGVGEIAADRDRVAPEGGDLTGDEPSGLRLAAVAHGDVMSIRSQRERDGTTNSTTGTRDKSYGHAPILVRVVCTLRSRPCPDSTFSTSAPFRLIRAVRP
jgi:hypothetical protein